MPRELFDSLPSPRLVVDSSGKPVAVTTSSRKLLGEAENSLGVLAEIAAKDGADGRDRFDRLVAVACDFERSGAAGHDIDVDAKGR